MVDSKTPKPQNPKTPKPRRMIKIIIDLNRNKMASSLYEKDLKKHDMINFGIHLAHGLHEQKKQMGIENTFHGLVGPDEANIFNLNHCETDRFWRAMWQITPERYQKMDIPQFDECRNAY